jgi:hypothetical protein
MPVSIRLFRASAALVLAAALMAGGCATSQDVQVVSQAGGQIAGGLTPAQPSTDRADEAARFEKDRKAILAMAGDYRVRFDFTETVSFDPAYTIKEPKRSGGYEVVRVIEDRGDFVSLQHILVSGTDEDAFPIKHWRQDWRYEPASVLIFVGGNTWRRRDLSEDERRGKWSQTVYQVEDSPRYGALAAWSHANGVSEWTPPAELRPLPRREATTRNDYEAILAVNRHAITPDGWVHEQDNSKVVLRGETPKVLAREFGLNSYRTFDAFDETVATKYWDATKEFWTLVRADWDRLEREAPVFGLTVQGEPEPLYGPLLELADAVAAGSKSTDEAVVEAKAVIARFTTTSPAPLQQRLTPAAKQAASLQ